MSRVRGTLVPGRVDVGPDHRQRPAGRCLARQHQLEPRLDVALHQRDHPKDVLYRVPKAQAIPLPVVDERGMARPGIGYQRVVRVPNVDHAVEFGIWRVRHHRVQVPMRGLLDPG